MQQIETIMELLDELRENEKKKQHVPKKQIHFSDSSDYYEATNSSGESNKREREKTLIAGLKSVKHEVNLLPNRRQRKSIASTDIIWETPNASTSADKVTHLLARYSLLKKLLE